MVKYGDSGLAHDHRRQHGRHRPKRQPMIDAFSVFFFVFLHAPSLFLRLFLSMKRKSRTSCQPIALALGHSVFGYRRNHSKTCEDDRPYISEDDHENFGEERVAGRASLVSSSL